MCVYLCTNKNMIVKYFIDILQKCFLKYISKFKYYTKIHKCICNKKLLYTIIKGDVIKLWVLK